MTKYSVVMMYVWNMTAVNEVLKSGFTASALVILLIKRFINKFLMFIIIVSC